MQKLHCYSMLKRAVVGLSLTTILISLLFVFAPTAWAQEITATLRIEYAEDTLMAPTQITLVHNDLATHYGLVGIDDPGYITAFHVLAEGLEQTFGPGAAADKLGFSLTSFGPFLETINDSNGSLNNEDNFSWTFVLNQAPAPVGLLGHRVVSGDEINLSGRLTDWDTFKLGWITSFDRASYSLVEGQSLELRLTGHDPEDWGATGFPTTGISQAQILIDPLDANRIGATTQSAFTTNAQGVATLSFDRAGTFLLSALRTEAGGIFDITRPFAVVTVTEIPRWDSFRGNAFNSALVNAPTPLSTQSGTAVWTQSVASPGVAVSPVKVGDYIYLASGTTLRKINGAGQTVKTEQLSQATRQAAFTAAGSGMIFVPVGSGSVEAFNA
ncbi:MAG: DUF4198 domain-containing protein, partial [Coriobacteriia bacterium]|nr:DUF4198 domain-containing protein [Coriobacteriia bacterium]